MPFITGQIRNGWFGIGTKIDESGVVTGKSVPDFSDYEVGKARQFYGRSASMYQAAYTYEMGKAGDDEEYGEMLNRNIANLNGWASRLKPDAGAIQLGSGFAMQSARKEGKHLKLKVATKSGIDATGKRYAAGDLYYDVDHAAFARDMAENVNNYTWSNMKTSTTAEMVDAYDWATDILSKPADDREAKTRDGELITPLMRNSAAETVRNIRLSAQSIDTRYGGGTRVHAAGEGEEAPVIEPVAEEVPSSAAAARRIHTGAAGRVDDELNLFVDHVLGPVGPTGDRSVTAESRAAVAPNIRARRRGLTNGPPEDEVGTGSPHSSTPPGPGP